METCPQLEWEALKPISMKSRGRERDLYAGTFDGCKKKTSLGEGEKK